MDQFHYLESKIIEVESELAEVAKPFAHLIEKLDEIQGVDKTLAMGILAEATNQMAKFKDERSFAAWRGVAAGNNESAGKKKIKNQERKPASKENPGSGSAECKIKAEIFLPSQV